MKRSPILHVLMAAIIYLLLMWGYLMLQTPQQFAAFSALILGIAVIFWVRQVRSLERAAAVRLHDGISGDITGTLDEGSTLASSVKKLDALKAELSAQYAQFGQDQAAMNSKGLGTWQRRRPPGGEQ